MVVNYNRNANHSLAASDMDQPTIPHPDLLVAKREPTTGMCKSVLESWVIIASIFWVRDASVI